MKRLEKNDIARGKLTETDLREEQEETRALSEVENILADMDINTLSPMQALLLLQDLKEKVTTEK